MKLINSILKSIFNISLTGKIILFFRSIYQYAKDYNYVADAFYNKDGFRKIVKNYLHIELDKDWLGRLYGVINPTIDIDGKFNINNVIIEIDGSLTNDNEYVKSWLYKQLYLVQNLFNFEHFYNYISMDLHHVGPAIADNYLVVFDIASRQNIGKYFRQIFWQTLIYAVIGLVIFYLFIV